MRAEHAPEGRLVAPISWATLSVHVVASPGSYGASETVIPMLTCGQAGRRGREGGKDLAMRFLLKFSF